ncbi:MAG: bifunctional metallophosphatase/5'-nucleotidase [Bacteroidales bacterium]|nr:bifunctional metallophosphatase/5'-nucleotidase [Bacteroidales bacterium]
MKKISLILTTLILAIGCSPRYYNTGEGKPIVIYFDNDVHCAADGYTAAAALKAESASLNPNVLLVSAGDYVQGGSLGAASKGQYIIDIINRCGYDVVTLGNHEFDYGMIRLDELSKNLKAEIACCNLYDLRSGAPKLLFQPYVMRQFGKAKVAILGISTPYSFVSSTPSYFQDKTGKYVYSLSADTFYETIQKAVDSARKEGADYVIAITHLGDDAFDQINALTTIANTSGIDAVLDGHSHSTIAGNVLKNAAGKPVLHCSTGSHFENVGQLTILTDGRMISKLIPVGGNTPKIMGVTSVTDSIKNEYALAGNRVVGRSEVELIVADEDGPRVARQKETGLGDFCVDAIRHRMNTDIAVLGGGSVRAPLPEGKITYNDIFTVFPFGNTVATDVMTGREILDMLEMSVIVSPVEFGGFLQVSGLKMDVDNTIPTPIQLDVNKTFTKFTQGPRRVSNVQILQKDGSYAPIDLDKEYTVSGTNYLLKEHGDGYGSLTGKRVVDTGVVDLQILEAYLTENLGGVIPARYAKTEGRINFKK